MSGSLRALKLLVLGGVAFVLSQIVSLAPLVGLPPFPQIFAGYLGGRAAGNPVAGLAVGVVAALMQVTLSVYTLSVVANSTAAGAEAVTGLLLFELAVSMVALPLAGLFGGKW